MSDFTEDPVLNLYKLEYDNGNLRYNNIYQAMWTNFSYMAIVAGGILTFGKDSQLSITFLGWLSCFPLLFWFWVSYIPLNKYGNAVSHRLAEIEAALNKNIFAGARQVDSSVTDQFLRGKHREGLHLYSDFENRKENKRMGPVRFVEDKLRVRHSIWVFSICLHLLFVILTVWLFIGWLKMGSNILKSLGPADQTVQQMQGISNRLDETDNKLRDIGNSLQDIRNTAIELRPKGEKLPSENKAGSNANVTENKPNP